MRSLAICLSEVMPVDSCTAKPMTSQEGNTAMVRNGMRPSRGPLPLYARVTDADGLIHAMEILPSASILSSRKLSAAKESATQSSWLPRGSSDNCR